MTVQHSALTKSRNDKEKCAPSSLVFSWCLYDFANSAYPTVILTALYVLYFKSVIASGYTKNEGDLLWGGANAFAGLLVLAVAPLLGIVADVCKQQLPSLAVSTVACALFTGFLAFPSEGMVVPALVILVLASIAFEVSMIFYSSLLSRLAPAEKLGRLSGYGWALGYVGGLSCLLCLFPFVKNHMQVVPVFVALWYLLFSLPLFWCGRTFFTGSTSETFAASLRPALNILRTRYKELPANRTFFKFLIAYFFYNNGVLTVILFAATFAADSLAFSTQENIFLILVMNVIAAPGAIVFGHLADRAGCRRVLTACLLLWLLVIAGAVVAVWPNFWSVEVAKGIFWVVAFGASLGIGAVQSTSRTFVALLAPRSQQSEYFGFFALAGKGSAVLGPLVYGGVSFASGSQMLAVGSIGLFFLVGVVLLYSLEEQSAVLAEPMFGGE